MTRHYTYELITAAVAWVRPVQDQTSPFQHGRGRVSQVPTTIGGATDSLLVLGELEVPFLS